MPVTMSDAEYAAILSARNSGITQVSYMGRTVTYRSLDEMDRILAREDARRAGGRRSFIRIKTRSDSGC